MSGYVYLIRNGDDLYKIGITQNLEQRMKQLKPDQVVKTLETENYEQLEKQLHKRYKDVRLPQSEYFRLTDSQLESCKKTLLDNSSSDEGNDGIDLKGVSFVLVLLFIVGAVNIFDSAFSKTSIHVTPDWLLEGIWYWFIPWSFLLAGLYSFCADLFPFLESNDNSSTKGIGLIILGHVLIWIPLLLK